MAQTLSSLPAPLDYFPLSARPFEFSAGLRPLPELSTSPHDQIFQLDQQWPQYRQNKLDARHERFDKYVCQTDLTAATARAATEYLLQQLCAEHGAYFHREPHSLHCTLSQETLHFDDELQLQDNNDYHNSLDALCCQIQEDLAIIELKDGRDHVSYLHLCAPNHWAAQDKIGHGFHHAHAPIPAIERINRQTDKLVRSLIEKGPFERFAWGLATDARLNHHPEPAPGIDADTWRGRDFDPAQPQLFLRIERQTMIGLPTCDAFIFTIRSYHRHIATLNAQQCATLSANTASMPPEIKTYKGLHTTAADIISYLNELSST